MPCPNKKDQIYGQKLAKMVKKHSSEAFYAFDDPLEAAISASTKIAVGILAMKMENVTNNSSWLSGYNRILDKSKYSII